MMRGVRAAAVWEEGSHTRHVLGMGLLLPNYKNNFGTKFNCVIKLLVYDQNTWN